MNPPGIVTAREENRERVIQSIVLGFSADPLARWFWPQASVYLKSGPIFDAFGGRAIDHDSAFVTQNYEGAALWLPPGVEPDEERMIPMFQASVDEDIIDDVLGVFEAMDEYHPKDPCWYLPLIAVDPGHQGNGFGSQLMKHALSKIDEEGSLAYLESSNPRNISLYERFGFEIIGQIQVGSSPLIQPMLRPGR